MKGVVIREYRNTDHDACVALQHELAQHHAVIYGDPAIAEHDPVRSLDKYLALANHAGTWVAETDGKVIGFVGLLDVIGEEGVVEIEPMVITTAYRDRGVGSQLVAYVKETAKKKGYRFLSVRPELRNEEAFKLYVKLGFGLVGGVELFQDLMPERGRTWKSGVEILGQKLKY
jgi:ribosomal protein S18 acetylase RimI-like enzyme